MVSEHRINITIETITRGSLKKSGEDLKKINGEFKDLGIKGKKTGSIIKETTSGWLNQTKVLKTYTRDAKGIVRLNKQVETGAKQFRMEWLGIMFAGIALSKTISNLTKGAMDWLGVSELFQLGLDLIMLESLLPFSDSMYSAADSMINFSQKIKGTMAATVIGFTAILGQLGGMALSTVGQLVLALTSLTMAFPQLKKLTGPAIGLMVSGMGALLGNIEGMPSEFRLIGATLASVGAILATSPLTEFIDDIPIVGDFAAELVASLAGIGGFAFGGGITALVDVFKDMQDQISESTKSGIVYNNALNLTQQTVAAIGDRWKQVPNEKTTNYKIPDSPILASIVGNISDRWKSIPDEKTTKYTIIYSTQKEGGEPVQVIPEPTTPADVIKAAQDAFDIDAIKKKIANEFRKNPYTFSPVTAEAARKYISEGYQYGGVVSGKMGEPVPIIAHGGERFEGIHGGGSAALVKPSGYTYLARTLQEATIEQARLSLIGEPATITEQYQHGGIVPGRFGEPVPIIAHGGERFEGMHGENYTTPNFDFMPIINAINNLPILYPREEIKENIPEKEVVINFSPVYNINVSDKSEMEDIIKKQNERLVDDLRRMAWGG